MVQNRPAKALTGILLNRLALAPVLCIAMLWGFDYLLPVLSDAQLCVIAIVLVMPVSVTSTVITETMNQDTSLAAQAVLYTTPRFDPHGSSHVRIGARGAGRLIARKFVLLSDLCDL